MAYEVLFENAELGIEVKIEGKQMLAKRFNDKEWKELKTIVLK